MWDGTLGGVTTTASQTREARAGTPGAELAELAELTMLIPADGAWRRLSIDHVPWPLALGLGLLCSAAPLSTSLHSTRPRSIFFPETV